MATVHETLVLEDRFSSKFSKYIKLAGKASEATERAKKRTEEFSKAQKLASASTGALTNRIESLVGAYAGLKGVKNLLNLSDETGQTTARINMMNDGLQTTEELTKMVYSAAQRSRGAYTETADMVAKLGNLAGNAFNSSQEIAAFAEQLNKQLALSGASTAGAKAAMLQLTQAMSSGVLRGEELNSILEQAPTIAQSIAKYLGMTVGEMRALASEGAITSRVVKDALFSAAEETNAKFAELPITWGQIFTQLQNFAIQAFQPILEKLSALANSPEFEQLKVNIAMAIQFIANTALQAFTLLGNIANFVAQNWSVIEPILYGVAAGIIAYKVATLAMAAAQWILNGALLASPLTWIVLAIVAVVAAIAYWVQAVGGLHVAWLIVVDAVLYGWDLLKYGFYVGVFWVMDLMESMALGFQEAGVAIANFMGQMKANVLTIIQNMVNGAIDIINWFIEQLNKLPGVSIEAIAQVTFGATAAAEEAAAASSRNAGIAAKKAQTAADKANRQSQLKGMMNDLKMNHANRQQEIHQLQAKNASGEEKNNILDMLNGNANIPEAVGGGGGTGGLDDIGGSVGGSLGSDVADIKKEVSMSEEELKSLVDMAERKYVNNINLTAQTPVINVTGQNTGNSAADRKALANAIRDMLLKQQAEASLRSTARVK